MNLTTIFVHLFLFIFDCEQINWFHDSILKDVYYYILLIFGPQIPSCDG